MEQILGKIFSASALISLVFAIVTGNLEALAAAVLDGSAKAVTLTLALAGAMGFWSGIMRVLSDVGVCRVLAKLIHPVLRLIFPESVGNGVASEEIAGCISANMLGLGNAATPMGIRAMEAMAKASPNDGEASEDMITFVVMNTCPLSLLPTTLIALRRAAGSADPFAVLVPIWISSAVCSVAAVIFAKAFALLRRRKAGQ